MNGTPEALSDLEAEFRNLLVRGLTQSDALNVLHAHGAAELSGTTAEIVIDKAGDLFCSRSDDNIEVDSNALFSQGDDGVWVSAWVHVSNAELGIFDPLPDELVGKLWIVRADVSDIPPCDRVVVAGNVYGVYPVESFEQAIEEYDRYANIQPHRRIVFAESNEAACAVFEMANTAMETWIDCPSDSNVGFSYLHPDKNTASRTSEAA